MWQISMQNFFSKILIPLALILSGCMQMTAQQEKESIAVSECTGSVVVPYGLSEVKNDNLLNQAQMPPGKGGLCKAKVLKVEQPLTIYRVWNKSKPQSKFGRWWSFSPPAKPVNEYRYNNAICPEWSVLNQVTQCRLKVGSNIVVGTGQSALCANNLTYPQSATNQVYVPNDTSDVKHPNLLIEDCLPDTAWP